MYPKREPFSDIIDYINGLHILFKPEVKMSDEDTLSLAKRVEHQYIIEDFACSFHAFESNPIPFMFMFYPHRFKLLIPRYSYLLHLKTYDDEDIRLVFHCPTITHIEKLPKLFHNKEEALEFVIEKTSSIICEQIKNLFAYIPSKLEGVKEKSLQNQSYIVFSNNDHSLEIEFNYEILKWIKGGENMSPEEKEKIKKDLIKAGAIPRDKKLTPMDDYYSKSIGKRNAPILKVRF